MLALSIFLHGCSAELPVHDDDARAAEAQAAEGAQVDPGIADAEACHQGALAADAVFDVGHQTDIRKVTRAGDRILSATDQRWILWDATTQRRIATGALPNPSAPRAPAWAPVAPAALVQSFFLVPRGTDAHELRHADDGRLLVTLPTGTGVRTSGLSEDGGYAFSMSDTHLRVWTLEGQLRFERAGDYRDATVSAWANDLQIVHTAQDSQVETVDLTGKTVRSFTVPGKFDDWFTDGRHFVATTEEFHRVFTREGSVVREFPLPKYTELLSTFVRAAGGHGDFVWTYQSSFSRDKLVKESSTFRVFRLSDPSWFQTFENSGYPDASHDGSVAVSDGPRMRRLDLRGNELRLTEHWLPLPWLVAYSSDGSGWTVSYKSELYDLPQVSSSAKPSLLGCRGIEGLIASSSGRLAITTADRVVRVLETSDRTAELIGKFNGQGLSLTPDGHTLFLSYVRSVSLPGGEALHSWPSELSGIRFSRYDATVSATGERVALTYCRIQKSSDPPCVLQVTTNTGTLLYQTPQLEGLQNPVFSPSARRVAVTSGNHFNQTSYVYEEGKQVGRFTGSVLGWIDDERLVIPKAREPDKWNTTNDLIVVDLTGKELSKLSVEPLSEMPSSVDANHVLTRNALYRVSDGAVLVSHPGASHSALGGDEVFFAVDGAVVRRRWR